MKNNYYLKFGIGILIIFVSMSSFAQIESNLSPFKKIVVGPKINLVLSQGEQESLRIEYDHIEAHRINFKQTGQSLKIYLDDSRFIEKTIRGKDWGWRRGMYDGVEVTAYVTYTNLEMLDVRGEQEVEFSNPLDVPEFDLHLYGEPTVSIGHVTCGIFKAKLYGEIELNVADGHSIEQIYKLYGDSQINCSNFKGDYIKTTSFGDSELYINPKSLNVTALGEATFHYKGSPNIDKGIVIGEITFDQIAGHK